MTKPKADSKADRVDVQILDRSYQLSCPPEEKDLLMECVALVDTRMRQVKTRSKLQGADRIAVMAALTIARDCLTGKEATRADHQSEDQTEHRPEDKAEIQKKINELSALLDTALAPQERLF
jgi:cell division protein ZapA